MPKCGNCSQHHDTADAVRECYGLAPDPLWPASDAQIKYVLGLQVERDLPDEYDLKTEADLKAMDKAEVSRLIGELKVLPYKSPKGAVNKWTMPAGRYALNVDGEWKFYQVDDGKGRWDGYKFLVMLVGSPGQYQKVKLATGTSLGVLNKIEADSKQAMEDYGKQSGVCGRCSSPLTDPQSLALGIGPKCRAKSGWY